MSEQQAKRREHDEAYEKDTATAKRLVAACGEAGMGSMLDQIRDALQEVRNEAGPMFPYERRAGDRVNGETVDCDNGTPQPALSPPPASGTEGAYRGVDDPYPRVEGPGLGPDGKVCVSVREAQALADIANDAYLAGQRARTGEGAFPTAAHVVEARNLWEPFRSVLPLDDRQEKVVVSAIATALASRPPEVGGGVRKAIEAAREHAKTIARSGSRSCWNAAINFIEDSAAKIAGGGANG